MDSILTSPALLVLVLMFITSCIASPVTTNDCSSVLQPANEISLFDNIRGAIDFMDTSPSIPDQFRNAHLLYGYLRRPDGQPVTPDVSTLRKIILHLKPQRIGPYLQCTHNEQR